MSKLVIVIFILLITALFFILCIRLIRLYLYYSNEKKKQCENRKRHEEMEFALNKEKYYDERRYS